MDIIHYYLGIKISNLRREKGLTQEKMAQAIGIQRISVANIENGRTGTTLQRLFKIAELFNIEVNELLPDLDWYSKNKNKKVKIVTKLEIYE